MLRKPIGVVTLLSVAMIAMSGCGDDVGSKPTAHLQGTVTIAGKPIPSTAQAIITFSPTTATQADGTSGDIKDGKFDVPAVPKGPVQVLFTIHEPTGKMFKFDPGARPEPELRDLVPANKANGVPLSVDGDKSDVTFDL